jgi:hypothetical protein
MDSLVDAAARALSLGDPLGALKLVALREDAPALALRGIALAQLGDFPRGRALIRAARRAFGPAERLHRARCLVAEAEIALASRDLGWLPAVLDQARTTLEALGDRVNAAHARYLGIRRDLLIGRLDEALLALERIEIARQPPALRAIHELMLAGIAIRRLQIAPARAALARADRAANEARIPALAAEVATASRMLDLPVAQLHAQGKSRLMRLEEMETVLASGALVVDACRNTVSAGKKHIQLARRPVLFALLRALAEAWPGDVPRGELVRRVFRARTADDTYRARLRVETGRLRRLFGTLAAIDTTREGYALRAHGGREVLIVSRLSDEGFGVVLALLADGEAWSSSALALALGTSQRSVQRALDALSSSGKVQSYGRGRSRRWLIPPAPGFATSLLLPVSLPVS